MYKEEEMNKRQSSPKAAAIASKILQDDRYSENAKTCAGSVLSQARKDKKSK